MVVFSISGRERDVGSGFAGQRRQRTTLVSIIFALSLLFVASCLGVVAAGLVWWHDVHAATQGSLGASSTASASISLSIPEHIRLSGLQDVALGQWTGAGGLVGQQTVCVYTNGDGQYRLTQTGQNTLQNGAHSVPYQVYFNDQPQPGGGTPLTPQVPLTGQTGANTQAADCSQGGHSAALRVEVSGATLGVARAGAYQGTLTLVAEVE